MASKNDVGRGSRRLGLGRGRHTSDIQTKNQTVCKFFLQGKCTYGIKCRFPHYRSSHSGQSASGLCSSEATEKLSMGDDNRAAYVEWKRHLKSPPDKNAQYRIDQLWGGALNILNGDDKDLKQKLAQDIVSSDFSGCNHIRHIIMLPKDTFGTSWEALRDFLLVVTHKELLNSLAIDVYVGEMYILIRGSNGERVIQFLTNLCKELTMSIIRSQAEKMLVINAASTLLRWTMKKDIKVRFHEGLLECLNQIETIANDVAAETIEDQGPLFQRILQMRAMIGKAQNSAQQVRSDDSTHYRPEMAHGKEIAVPGGRHDNDHANIEDIIIFPTISEIKSDEPEYLPTTDRDVRHHLIDRAARHIDTQFRLFRHDIFKELTEALGQLHLDKTQAQQNKNIDCLSLGDIRANQYKHACIQFVDFQARGGLQFHISFAQPKLAALEKMSEAERRAWWMESKRLSEGVLISLVTIDKSKVNHIFLIIVKKTTRENVKESEGRTMLQGQSINVVAKLANLCETDLHRAVLLSCGRTKCLLIEFPGIIPATFKPILENLQMMQKDSRLPFQDWILPGPLGTPKEPILPIPPPSYARGPRFSFSLNSIILADQANVFVQPREAADIEKIKTIESATGLDQGQSEALVAALTREFAFIQGPPGTGKSYLGVQLMKVLLDHKTKAQLGPIVVVCYTNHALDQFLEHLLADDIHRIIRVGRQGKSELLERYNLSEVRRMEPKTKSEKWHVAMSYKKLDTLEQRIRRDLGRLHTAFRGQPQWRYLEHYLSKFHSHISDQFQGESDDGFHVAGRHVFDQWAESATSAIGLPPASIDLVLRKAAVNVHSLDSDEKGAIITFWMQEMQMQAQNAVLENIREAMSTDQDIVNIHDEAGRRALERCDVIGITTTGLAKSINLLQHVQAKVVICEEAGEVMEPHILCALLPAVQHFIQIGDHQQLRPQINSHSLSLESKKGMMYQLDRSQFERLSVGEPNRQKMPLVQLNLQRRMRPEISSLVRRTLYPNLQDHASTLNKQPVVGLRYNLFWLDHTYPESSPDAELHHRSYSNRHEVALVHALVRHIIRQGVYRSSDIAVLTPYTGQLSKLRAVLQNNFEIVLSERDQDDLDLQETTTELVNDNQRNHSTEMTSLIKKKLIDLLRIATVDNFQGEEAKIVIVSLVRSNDVNKVGFLGTTNRINVLLSRAQNGLYLVGNAETYRNVQMWQQVINILQADGKIGKSIGLCCPRHTETPLEVSSPEDFDRLSPEGGCLLACTHRLLCGHACYSRCHSESMHSAVNCSETCQRLYEPCKHPCHKPTCGEPCGVCKVVITDVELTCGHRQDVLCHLAQDITKIRCTTLIERRISGCLHLIPLQCAVDITSAEFRCPKECAEFLACGHKCPGTCGQCRMVSEEGVVGFKHKSCQAICKKPQASCEHLCRQFCHSEDKCSPCKLPCEVRCQHSQCKQLCSEPCAPCIEACTWSCKHKGVCTMPCGAPCDRLPCDERCEKLLDCGHQCPGICGEDCLVGSCQECGDKLDDRVDLVELRAYKEIALDVDRVALLSCGHLFTMESLDGMIGLHDLYTLGTDGHFDGLKEIPSQLASRTPACPDCNCPLRQHSTRRYGRLVNRAVVDSMTKKFIIESQNELAQWSSNLDDMMERLEDSEDTIARQRTSSIPSDRGLERNIEQRLIDATTMNANIIKFVDKVAHRNQPAQKLHQAIVHAQRRKENQSMESHLGNLELEDETVPEPTRSVLLGAKVLQVRSKQITLQEQYCTLNLPSELFRPKNIRQRTKSSIFKSIACLVDECQEVIKDCVAAKLPKLAVRAILYLSDVVASCRASMDFETCRGQSAAHVIVAQRLLDDADALCTTGFQDSNALQEAVKLMVQRLKLGHHYQKVTEEEKAMIKVAMLSGRDSLATHSGHWYNCVNGHPFAIGECGMPMELARCPECNAPIGGQRHQAVDGVSRAENME